MPSKGERLVAPLVLLGLGPLAAGQDAEQRIAALEERLALLEAEESRPGLGMGASYGDVSATFQIFGDVSGAYRTPDLFEDANKLIHQGAATFFVNAQMGDHFRVLSETVVTTESSASQERLWGAWTFSDELYTKFGTEHANVSRWNQLNHHGAWLETTIQRPYIARFEGDDGILPMHRTGLELGGTMATGGGRVEYYGTVSNGRGPVPSDKQRGLDTDDEFDYDLGFAYLPEALPDLRFGAVVQANEIPDDPASSDPLRASSIEETVASVHVQYQMGPVELFGEFGWIWHDIRADGSDTDHTTGYLQLAWQRGDWTPYARIDFRDMDEGDPFFAPQDRDLDRWTQILGARYELTTNAALKLEVSYGEQEFRDSGGSVSEDDVVGCAVQLAWWL